MRRVLLALVMCVCVLTGVTPAVAQSLPVEVTLTIDRSAYELRAPIAFTIHALNPNPRPLSLMLNFAQPYDLVLHDGLIDVARLSRQGTGVVAPDTQQIGSGQMLTYVGQWAPSTSLLPTALGAPTFNPPAPGVYTIHAELATLDRRPVSAARPLFIGRPVIFAAGCTSIEPDLLVRVPVTLLAAAVEPESALKGMWRFNAPAIFTGYSPAQRIMNDLQTVNPGDTITLCLDPGGRVLLPTSPRAP